MMAQAGLRARVGADGRRCTDIAALVVRPVVTRPQRPVDPVGVDERARTASSLRRRRRLGRVIATRQRDPKGWVEMDDNLRLARTWMIVAGIALIAAGLIGFVPGNAIASADPDALFRVNATHNIVHLATGLLALAIAFATSGRTLADATIGFGVLYAAVAVVLVLDPTLFGLFEDAPANAADHLLHAGLAIVSIALGVMARQRVPAASYRV